MGIGCQCANPHIYSLLNNDNYPMKNSSRVAIYSIFVALLSPIVWACSSRVSANLDIAEELMHEQPDSALAILKRISPDELRTKEETARRALLLSIALDKNYIDVSNDSLTSIALRYYSTGSDNYSSMLAYYYHGRVAFNANNYSLAIVSLFNSRDLALKINEYYWLSLISRSISDVYNITYNGSEELKFAQDEYKYAKLSGRQPYINYAQLDLARALSNNGNDNEAIELCKQTIDSAAIAGDDYLAYSANQLIGQCLVTQDKFAEANEIFEQFASASYATVDDSLYLALSYAAIKNSKTAREILNNISETNQPLIHLAKYSIYKNEGNYENALEECERHHALINDTFRKRIRQNLSTAVVESFERSKLTAEQERDSSRLLTIVIVIFTFCIIVVFILYFQNYRKVKRNEIEKNVLIALHLQTTLNSTTQEYSKAQDSIKMLLSSKYEVFDNLCKFIYENNKESVARKKISDAVVELINQMKTDNIIISQLESIINTHHANLITNFKDDLPSLSEQYYKLFLFSVLGFSDITISIFLGKENSSLIWNTRRHLKDKIKKLPTDKQNKYLSYL